ncbi:hypothetical protein QFC24_006424 [Naganishia onofrii]|uniref:Uncharacterized protein n=1 Tax=Naganishia onofrii TaxID=1851511 RepID=A0ACC2X294_9TREE|nr:hypothetical protein QFC24_006424 [Naganishia onofrii]
MHGNRYRAINRHPRSITELIRKRRDIFGGPTDGRRVGETMASFKNRNGMGHREVHGTFSSTNTENDTMYDDGAERDFAGHREIGHISSSSGDEEHTTRGNMETRFYNRLQCARKFELKSKKKEKVQKEQGGRSYQRQDMDVKPGFIERSEVRRPSDIIQVDPYSS